VRKEYEGMRVQRDASRRLLHFAKQMRREAPDAEKRMWSILRSRKLSGFKFRRQYPVGGYIVDYYCVKERLGIELDGGQHADKENLEYDARRTERLIELGVRVMRFWDHDVLKHTDVVAESILRMLTTGSEPSPQPSPGLPGEGAEGGDA
jgi:very-short-patch-repair endonuclease